MTFDERIQQITGWLTGIIGVAVSAVAAGWAILAPSTAPDVGQVQTWATELGGRITQLGMLLGGLYLSYKGFMALFFSAQASRDAAAQLELKKLDLKLFRIQLKMEQTKAGFGEIDDESEAVPSA